MDINDITRIAKIIRALPLRDAITATADLTVGEAVGEMRYIIAREFAKELGIGALVRELFMTTSNPAHPVSS